MSLRPATLASAATTGLGIPPRKISRIIGVTKAYSDACRRRTDADRTPRTIILRANSWARQQRRPGESAARAGSTSCPFKFTARLNGTDALFVTKLDTLSGIDELKICVGYKLDGKPVHFANLEGAGMARVEPVYRSLRGWKQDLTRHTKI